MSKLFQLRKKLNSIPLPSLIKADLIVAQLHAYSGHKESTRNNNKDAIYKYVLKFNKKNKYQQNKSLQNEDYKPVKPEKLQVHTVHGHTSPN